MCYSYLKIVKVKDLKRNHYSYESDPSLYFYSGLTEIQYFKNYNQRIGITFSLPAFHTLYFTSYPCGAYTTIGNLLLYLIIVP